MRSMWHLVLHKQERTTIKKVVVSKRQNKYIFICSELLFRVQISSRISVEIKKKNVTISPRFYFHRNHITHVAPINYGHTW